MNLTNHSKFVGTTLVQTNTIFSRTSTFTSVSETYNKSHETSASFSAEQDLEIDGLEEITEKFGYEKNLKQGCTTYLKFQKMRY